MSFLAHHAPKLKDWQREVLEIVRRTAQYFYPQRQTKLMNEGCATFVHYEIMNRLYEPGQIEEGSMLEFLHMHAAVIAQPDFDHRRFSGLNPYALGFAMMQDIKRICEDPEPEDLTVVPRVGGQRPTDGNAARRLVRIPGRELRPAVPEPTFDPRDAIVRGLRSHANRLTCRSRRSTTKRVTARSVADWPANTICRNTNRKSKLPRPI